MPVPQPRLFPKAPFRHGTVLLNWHGDPPGEARFLAAAFHELGKKAVLALRRRRTFPSGGLDDFHACPIVFLYRHALEVYLKAVLIAAGPLRSAAVRKATEEQLSRHHKLVPLTQEMKRLFVEHRWPWPESLEDLRRLAQEFDSVDPASFSFRYTTDKQGRAALPHRFQFDLFAFCAVLDEHLPDLDGWVSVMEERVDESLGRT